MKSWQPHPLKAETGVRIPLGLLIQAHPTVRGPQFIPESVLSCEPEVVARRHVGEVSACWKMGCGDGRIVDLFGLDTRTLICEDLIRFRAQSFRVRNIY